MPKIPSMPIDVKKTIDAVTSIGQERDQAVKIEIVFDPTASSELVDMVLAAFVDVESKAKISTVVLGETVPKISKSSDLCIVVGGDSLLLGDVVNAAGELDVPAVIIIARGKTYFSNNQRAAQAYADYTLASNAAPTLAGNAQAPVVGKGIALESIIDIDVDAKDKRPLEELGTWIVQNVPEKRISLAATFPFLRHPLAVELAKENTIQNAAIGLVFFVPGADMPLITLNQARMVIQIAIVYGKELDRERIREVVAVIAGAFGFRAIARRLTAQIPILGWAIKPAVAASGTMAMAIAAIEFFEEEGKLHGLSGTVDKAWGKVEPLVDKGADMVGSVVKDATTHA